MAGKFKAAASFKQRSEQDYIETDCSIAQSGGISCFQIANNISDQLIMYSTLVRPIKYTTVTMISDVHA